MIRACGLFLAISVKARAALQRTTVPLSRVFFSRLGTAFAACCGYFYDSAAMASEIPHLTLGAL